MSLLCQYTSQNKYWSGLSHSGVQKASSVNWELERRMPRVIQIAFHSPLKNVSFTQKRVAGTVLSLILRFSKRTRKPRPRNHCSVDKWLRSRPFYVIRKFYHPRTIAFWIMIKAFTFVLVFGLVGIEEELIWSRCRDESPDLWLVGYYWCTFRSQKWLSCIYLNYRTQKIHSVI